MTACSCTDKLRFGDKDHPLWVFVVCTLEAGHQSPHWDSAMRVSWNGESAVMMAGQKNEVL
jgi:hypothetical protein